MPGVSGKVTKVTRFLFDVIDCRTADLGQMSREPPVFWKKHHGSLG